jgi:hypothetical protein
MRQMLMQRGERAAALQAAVMAATERCMDQVYHSVETLKEAMALGVLPHFQQSAYGKGPVATMTAPPKLLPLQRVLLAAMEAVPAVTELSRLSRCMLVWDWSVALMSTGNGRCNPNANPKP